MPCYGPVDPAPWPPQMDNSEEKRLVLYLFIANAGQEVCLYRVLMLVLWMFECN